MAKGVSGARGGHHCPHKDGKRSHAIKDSCVRKEHGGYCPTFGRFVCFRNGCIIHKFTGATLLASWAETVEEEKPEETEEVEEVKNVKADKKDKKDGKRSKRN